MKKRTAKKTLCAVIVMLILAMTACGKEKTLEDYMKESPEARQELEAEMEAASGDQMDVTAEVKENDFIFSFTIKDESILTDDIGSILEAGLDATSSIFSEAAAALDKEMGKEGVATVVIKYLDPDGNVLAERSFKAE